MAEFYWSLNSFPLAYVKYLKTPLFPFSQEKETFFPVYDCKEMHNREMKKKESYYYVIIRNTMCYVSVSGISFKLYD